MEEESKPAEPVVEPPKAEPVKVGLTAEQLASVLSAKQKRKLGLLPPREHTEKEKNRLEALRERMRAINNKRKEDKQAKVAAVKSEPIKRKKPEPEPESEEESSSDQYIQKKAKKVNKTLHQLSKMEQYMEQLKSQNSHNPYFNLLMR